MIQCLRRISVIFTISTVSLLLASRCTAPPSGGGPAANGNSVADTPIVLNADGTVSTIAGTGSAGFSGDNGSARTAQIDTPMDVAFTADEALLIADFRNHRIRRIDLATGMIRTIAGDGQANGPLSLNSPTGVRVPRDGSGFLAVAWAEHRVFRYAPDGSRTELAGNGSAECSAADQQLATTVPVFAPRNLDMLVDGSVLISEQGCHRVRRVTRDGMIAPYAGTGEAGYTGDNASATMATLHAGAIEDGPSLGISLSPEDPPDQLFIADTANNVIRVIQLFTGRMGTFAGNGQPGFVDGPPEAAQFNRPTNCFTARDHSLWVVDSGNHAIRYIDPLRTRVVTVIGTGAAGFNGDSLSPAQTQLNNPSALWVTPDRRVFIADAGNQRIRAYQAQ